VPSQLHRTPPAPGRPPSFRSDATFVRGRSPRLVNAGITHSGLRVNIRLVIPVGLASGGCTPNRSQSWDLTMGPLWASDPRSFS